MWRSLWVGIVAATCAVHANASPPEHLQTDVPARAPTDRIERLTVWLDAISRHQPGLQDSWFRTISNWTSGDLSSVRDEVGTLVALIRDPSTTMFVRSVPDSIQFADQHYERLELDRLRALSKRSADALPKDATCPRSATPAMNAANRLLKRAALLHLETAISGPDETAQRTDTNSSSPVAVTFDDGRGGGVMNSAGHWEMARALLELVTRPCSTKRDPGADSWVRDWYKVALAYQQQLMLFDVRHADRAVDLFRGDADVLFLAGAMHEALATVGVQTGVGDSEEIRRRVRLGSTRAELAHAAEDFRRALRVRADHIEARIRRANVVGLLGRHAEAIQELRTALSAARLERTLEYYGRLLLGREAEATDDLSTARDAYARASQLLPNAQTPRLALSSLQWDKGDINGARVTLEPVLAQTDDAPSDDPWRRYYYDAGRSADAQLDALRASVP